MNCSRLHLTHALLQPVLWFVRSRGTPSGLGGIGGKWQHLVRTRSLTTNACVGLLRMLCALVQRKVARVAAGASPACDGKAGSSVQQAMHASRARKGAGGCRVLTWSACGLQGLSGGAGHQRGHLAVGLGPASPAERPRQLRLGLEPLAVLLRLRRGLELRRQVRLHLALLPVRCTHKRIHSSAI